MGQCPCLTPQISLVLYQIMGQASKARRPGYLQAPASGHLKKQAEEGLLYRWGLQSRPYLAYKIPLQPGLECHCVSETLPSFKCKYPTEAGHTGTCAHLHLSLNRCIQRPSLNKGLIIITIIIYSAKYLLHKQYYNHLRNQRTTCGETFQFSPFLLAPQLPSSPWSCTRTAGLLLNAISHSTLDL